MASSTPILVVEDNKVNQELAVRMLKKLGKSSVVANDGLEAIEKMQSTAFEIILTDISMPNMDGLELTKEIREHLPTLYKCQPYIIAMTANVLEADRQLCLNSGMNAYLAKPFNLADLRYAVSEAEKHFESKNQ